MGFSSAKMRGYQVRNGCHLAGFLDFIERIAHSRKRLRPDLSASTWSIYQVAADVTTGRMVRPAGIRPALDATSGGRMMPTTRSTTTAAAALGMVASLMLSGCSSEADYCSQLTATEAAYDDLASTDVLSEGTDTLSERYDAFSEQIDQLLDSAQAEFAEESDAVRAAVDQFGEVVDSAADLNLGDAAQQLVPALSSLQTSTTALFTSVTEACE